MSLNAKISWS